MNTGVLLLAKLAPTVVPLTIRQKGFSIIIAENKLCDQRKFMILTHFVHQDNLHKST